MKTSGKRFVMLLLSGLMISSATVRAQYPTISNEAKAEYAARTKPARERAEAAWERAQIEMREWETKGKPYIPWASHPYDLRQAPIPAFPGAEGGGMYSFGGRGGRVFAVSNLNDSGPGSFREACEAGGPRIVVFNVSGIIKLESRLDILAPYITIVGSSAPGDGVCIAGGTVELDTHDIVIRHMRFRRGQMDVLDRDDSLGGNPIGNLMIDHVSASWGLDENMSMYRHMYRLRNDSRDLQNPYVRSKYRTMFAARDPDNVDIKLPTVNISYQNCILSEGLNTFHHAFGSTIGGRNSTFHHNLWACNTGRNPSVGMDGDFGFVNNVIFNWVNRTVDGGDQLSTYNIINNYFKPGPATPTDKPIAFRILKPEERRSKTVKDFGHAYVNGNIVEGNEAVTKDNWNGGVQPEPSNGNNRDMKEILDGIRVEHPFSMAPVSVTTAAEAYAFVLDNSGATLPKRDPVDTRVIEMVRTGKPTAKADENTFKQIKVPPYSDEQTQAMVDLVAKGIITNPSQVGGYPEYKGEPYKDSDNDGIPDEWELKYGLNPNDPSDATKDMNGDGYSNIEKFLYRLDPKVKVDWTDPMNNVDTLAGGVPAHVRVEK